MHTDSIFRAIIAVMIELGRTSETSVNFNVTTQRHIPEDYKLHTRRHESLKSHMSSYYLYNPRCSHCLSITWNLVPLHTANITNHIHTAVFPNRSSILCLDKEQLSVLQHCNETVVLANKLIAACVIVRNSAVCSAVIHCEVTTQDFRVRLSDVNDVPT
jgi:hypothetical protein